MSKHAKYAPSHRGTPRSHAAVVAPKKALRNTLIVSSVAVTASGITVGGGLIGSGPGVSAAAADSDASVTPASFGDLPTAASAAGDVTAKRVSAGRAATAGVDSRRATPSRSLNRVGDSVSLKVAALSADGGPAVTGSESLADSPPKDIAMALLGDYGWDSSQFGCLDSLWTRESNWNPYAQNGSSGAYGIPQSLPGSKMASAGPDWSTNPVTQIRWGLGYIEDRYGSPCGAWGHSESYGWY